MRTIVEGRVVSARSGVGAPGPGLGAILSGVESRNPLIVRLVRVVRVPQCYFKTRSVSGEITPDHPDISDNQWVTGTQPRTTFKKVGHSTAWHRRNSSAGGGSAN